MNTSTYTVEQARSEQTKSVSSPCAKLFERIRRASKNNCTSISVSEYTIDKCSSQLKKAGYHIHKGPQPPIDSFSHTRCDTICWDNCSWLKKWWES